MFLTQLVQGLLFPPAILIALMVAGLIVQKVKPGVGRGLMVVGAILLIVFTNPWLAGEFRRGLEVGTPISATDLEQAQVLVVLGGGRQRLAAEYHGEDQVSLYTLARARYGAFLARETDLPLLVTGGSVNDEPVSEAALMAQLIEDEFKVPVRWREERSRNTYENAVFSAEMLAAQGLTRVALVTHAIHMPRAVEAFEKQGLTVFPAPTDITPGPSPEASWYDAVFPQSGAMQTFTLGLHELVGRLWYRLRYY